MVAAQNSSEALFREWPCATNAEERQREPELHRREAVLDDAVFGALVAEPRTLMELSALAEVAVTVAPQHQRSNPRVGDTCQEFDFQVLRGVLVLLPEVESEAPPAEFASDIAHLCTEYRRARDAYNRDGGPLESGIAARAVPSSAATDCPAAAPVLPFADADRESVAAGELEAKAGSNSPEAERLRIANERLWAYEDLTATVRATSLQGGMLSLLMGARWASWITDNDLTAEQPQEAADKVIRLLYSAQRVFERVPGAAPDPTLRDGYMPDRMDPWGVSTSAGSASHAA